MSLVILIPIGLLLLALILYFSRHQKTGGSGLGDRSDRRFTGELL